MQLPVSVCPARVLAANDAGDADLVERAQRDRDAFAALYREHYGRIANYVFRRTGDGHVTEDLVAEVFLSALRYLPRYRHRGTPVQAWLYRIATNEVNRWARRERRRTRRLFGRMEDIVDGAGDPNGDRCLPNFHRARLALNSISPNHQAVLALYYFEGLSIEEVAAAMGCRVGTVKSRLSRGRDALRIALDRLDPAQGRKPGSTHNGARAPNRAGQAAPEGIDRSISARMSGRTSL
jgi:RNA polymerase sigma-70 factor (ECF subfamily)